MADSVKRFSVLAQEAKAFDVAAKYFFPRPTCTMRAAGYIYAIYEGLSAVDRQFTDIDGTPLVTFRTFHTLAEAQEWADADADQRIAMLNAERVQ